MTRTTLGVVSCACVAVALACGPDDHVRFGQPNILVNEDPITEEACTCGSPAMGDRACPNFVSTIHAIFKVTCQGSACHDPGAAINNPPLLPLDDALATYDALLDFDAPGRTQPYIDDESGESYLLCNADDDDVACFGAQMPPGGFTEQDRAEVAAWVACGMPFDEEGEP
jgi:hypothetical protein